MDNRKALIEQCARIYSDMSMTQTELASVLQIFTRSIIIDFVQVTIPSLINIDLRNYSEEYKLGYIECYNQLRQKIKC